MSEIKEIVVDVTYHINSTIRDLATTYASLLISNTDIPRVVDIIDHSKYTLDQLIFNGSYTTKEMDMLTSCGIPRLARGKYAKNELKWFEDQMGRNQYIARFTEGYLKREKYGKKPKVSWFDILGEVMIEIPDADEQNAIYRIDPQLAFQIDRNIFRLHRMIPTLYRMAFFAQHYPMAFQYLSVPGTMVDDGLKDIEQVVITFRGRIYNSKEFFNWYWCDD